MSDNSAQEIKIFTYENMEEIEKFGIIKIPDSDKISFEDLLEFLPEIDGD